MTTPQIESGMMESLSSKTFTLGNVEFRVVPIPFAEGREIVDRVRVTLSRLKFSEMRESGTVDSQMGNLFLDAISLLTTSEMMDLQTRLFKYLEAKIPEASAYIPVLGNEELAFDGNVIHPYTATVRTFTASFLDSLLESLLGSGVEISGLFQSDLPT